MQGDPVGQLHGEIQRLKHSVNGSIYAVAALVVVVVALLISLIAVGVSQQSSIRHLREKVGGNEYFPAHPDEDAGAAFVLQSKGIIIMVFFS